MSTRLTYKQLQKRHPKLFARAQREVHEFYRSLGIVLKYHYRRLELPTQVLIEGKTPDSGKLQCYATASVPHVHEVDL